MRPTCRWGLPTASLVLIAMSVLMTHTPGIPVTQAQPPPSTRPLDIVGHIGGAPHDVRIVGRHAFVATGYALDVWDIGDPAQPTRVGRLLRPGARPRFGGDAGQRLRVYGDLAFLTDRSVVHIIDISDPTAPIRLDAFSRTEARVRDVARSGTTMYVLSDDDHGVVVVDITNPASPTEVTLTRDGAYGHLVAAGQYLYAVGSTSLDAPSERGLRVYDLSDPASPSPVSTTPGVSATYDLELVGTHLYATTNGGLRVYDIADPTAVTRIGEVDTAEPVDAVSVAGGRAYFTSGGVVEAVDVTDPGDPRRLGVLRVAERTQTAGNASVAAASGGASGLLVVTHTSYGGTFVDAADPTNMQPLEVFNTELPGSYELDVSDGHAYVLSGSGMVVIDVSDPARPSVIGRPLTSAPGFYKAVAVQRSRAYLLKRANGRHELDVFDVADPASPVRLGRLDFGEGHPDGLLLHGDRAYVAAQRYDTARSTPIESLHVVDISDPTAPREIGGLELPGVTPSGEGHPELALLQGRLLLATHASLVDIDISDPARPAVNGWLQGAMGPQSVYAVVASGDRAYLAFRSHYTGDRNSLALVDLTDPATPNMVSVSAPGYAAHSLALSADHVYTGAQEGVQRFVTSTLAAPLPVGSRSLPARVRDMVHKDGYLYVADDDAGLFILYTGDDDLPPIPPPPPLPPRTPSVTPSATSSPTSPAPTPTLVPPTAPPPTGSPPATVDCVCTGLLRRVPPAVVAHAVANPTRFYGWRLPLDANKPVGPLNPLRACLSMRSPSSPFHPLWNTLEWRVGCQ